MSEIRTVPLPVSVVVICWNSLAHIEGLIHGLSRQALFPPAEYIVIDNGSRDDAVGVLLRNSSFPWRCIIFPHNTGFARAANEGIRQSSCPYILLLNSDVVLDESYVQKLFSILDSKPRAGAVQGLLLRQGGTLIDSAGVSLDPVRRLPRDYLSCLLRDRMPPDKKNGPFLVEACNAAAVLLRRDLCMSMEREGQFFDERFVSYFEDVDVFHRASKLGWQFLCEPRAIAEHIRGGSGGLARQDIQKRSWLNRFRFYHKNESAAKRYLLRPWSIPLEGYRLFLKPLFSRHLRGTARTLLLELPDIKRLSAIESRYRAANISPIIGSIGPSPTPDGHETVYEKQCGLTALKTAANSEDVAVIIINYNTRALLTRCLQSLGGHASNYPIFVVDNASPDRSAAMVAADFPAVHLIELTENRGFAGAVNRALEEIDAKTCLILNADTEVSAEFPGLIAQRLLFSPGVGIIGPLIRNEDGSIQLSWGRTPNIFNEYCQRRLHQLYRQGRSDTLSMIARLYGRDRSVDWITGACLAIRRDTLRDIGPMDERFNLYFEDIDWCIRARKAGWLVLFSPSLSITHTGGAAASTCPRHASTQYRRSQQLFYRTHLSLFQQCLLWLFLRFGNGKDRHIGKFRKDTSGR